MSIDLSAFTADVLAAVPDRLASEDEAVIVVAVRRDGDVGDFSDVDGAAGAAAGAAFVTALADVYGTTTDRIWVASSHTDNSLGSINGADLVAVTQP